MEVMRYVHLKMRDVVMGRLMAGLFPLVGLLFGLTTTAVMWRGTVFADQGQLDVDTRTESVIQQAMNELMRGRTSFVIAHRLSTIRDADVILYMEHGDILEVGSHDQLMALHGRYEQLYQSQFG
jgi:ABC-type arginine transport system ATPase subunit